MPLSVNYNLFFLLLILIGLTAYFIVPILVIEQESPVFADTVYISMYIMQSIPASHLWKEFDAIDLNAGL